MTDALGADAAPYLEHRGSKWHVDLSGLNRQWLLRSGVLPEHIDTCALCTYCHPELFGPIAGWAAPGALSAP